MVSELRNELSITKEELIVTKGDHEQLEIEFEKQQDLQTEFVKEFNEKESRWKSRLLPI
jgi:hypothetical protein